MSPRLLLVALLVGACTSVSPSGPSQVALKTQPSGSLCMQAITVGTLVADSESGVGARNRRWPRPARPMADRLDCPR